MEPGLHEASWNLSRVEARRATRQHDGVLHWLDTAAPPVTTPVAVEVWVYSRDLSQVLLVHHRWRGWVPPGGKVEAGEHPRAAAAREVREETGVVVAPDPTPAASAVRAFHSDWTPTLALSYWAVIDSDSQRPAGEEGQPPEWKSTNSNWSTYFAGDARRVQAHAQWLAWRSPLA